MLANKEIKSGKFIHHGNNVRGVRLERDLTQTELGTMVNMPQDKISKLEDKPEIDDQTLKVFAKALDCDFMHLKTFSLLDQCGTYQENSQTIHSVAESKEVITQGVTHVYYYTSENEKELWERVIKLTSENAILKDKLEKYDK